LAEAVPQDMIAVRLIETVRFAAVASPDYLAARGRPTVSQDLYHHDYIRFRFESGAIYRWEFEHPGIAETINVAGPLTLTDQVLMVDAAIDGVGIAFVPDYLVKDALSDGRLERVLDEWCPPFPGVCLYYPGRRHVSTGLRALIDTIRSGGRSQTPASVSGSTAAAIAAITSAHWPSVSRSRTAKSASWGRRAIYSERSPPPRA
jgi:DNA-binding transcriptional LysR family regulator